MRKGEDSFYTGMTKNPRNRFNQHTKGYVKSTKRFNGNVKLVYLEKINGMDKKDVGSKTWHREKQIKRKTHNGKAALIIKYRNRTQDLINEYIWKAIGKESSIKKEKEKQHGNPYIDEILIKQYKEELKEYENKLNNIKKQLNNIKYNDIKLLDSLDISSSNPSTYFFQCEMTGAIKIGFATNTKKRFKVINAARPLPIRCVGLIPSSRNLERKLHKKFKEYRFHHEWFINGKDLVKYIKENT